MPPKQDPSTLLKSTLELSKTLSNPGLVVLESFAGWAKRCLACVDLFRRLQVDYVDKPLQFCRIDAKYLKDVDSDDCCPHFHFFLHGEQVDLIRGVDTPKIIRLIEKYLGDVDKQPEQSHVDETVVLLEDFGQEIESEKEEEVEEEEEEKEEEEEEVMANTDKMEEEEFKQKDVDEEFTTNNVDKVSIENESVKEEKTSIENIEESNIEKTDSVSKLDSNDQKEKKEENKEKEENIIDKVIDFVEDNVIGKEENDANNEKEEIMENDKIIVSDDKDAVKTDVVKDEQDDESTPPPPKSPINSDNVRP
eukprot:TRINITY_DN3078_c5_g11_i1.p1 TRINITY_DN3078_c5_g11~~TRINITY_DN3078_c5_g11_i1.p1  ORF type:complete len:307 (-),score=142.41 TRINITY_DN3078_c5_g11_i1:13-933(-)